MRKLKLSLLIFAAILMFSCKKDRTCSCQASGVEYKAELPNSKKDDAEASCGATELSLQYITDPNASCSLLIK